MNDQQPISGFSHRLLRSGMRSREVLLARLKAELFARQESNGCWRGRLSGSALSTAVGLFALARVDGDRYSDVIGGGVLWLRDNVNEDGGWGDTTVSKSNLSTTLLVWATLGSMKDRSDYLRPSHL